VRVLGLASAIAFVATMASGSRADAAYRATFPYHDADWLAPNESNGGAAVVPSRVPVGAHVPLVVFLHGVNMDMAVHAWSGAKGLPDMTVVADDLVESRVAIPFILAAPSQTRTAWSGRKMWQGFDLDEFADAVDRGLAGRAFVQRDVVIVMGHSGAGCNPDGGLLYAAGHVGKITPRAFVAIDTCMDAEVGAALAAAPASSRVVVRWQPDIWPRQVDEFHNAFLAIAMSRHRPDAIIEVVRGLGGDAHAAMAEDTFRSTLPRLLAEKPEKSAKK
jgi:hypothetical protein